MFMIKEMYTDFLIIINLKYFSDGGMEVIPFAIKVSEFDLFDFPIKCDFQKHYQYYNFLLINLSL